MKKIREFAAAPDVVAVGVLHDLNLAARFADNIVLLNEARVVAHGTAAEVFTIERIESVFGVKATFVPLEGAGLYLNFD